MHMYSRPRVKRLSALALGLIVAVPALAGCGEAGGANEDSANGTLRIVHGQTPNQFDPCGPANGSETSYMAAIYAPLIRSAPGTGELLPGIATEWVTSPDAKALTLTLKTGLTFQDGTPLNAETVKKSLEQCLAQGNQAIPAFESLTATGEDTVTFTMSKPSAGLTGLLASRLGMIASPAAREKSGDKYGTEPVGAGPYQMAKFVPANSTTLTKWEDYQEAGLPAARVGTLEISIITDPSAQVAALTGGQGDIGYRLDYSVPDGLEGTDVQVDVGVGVSFSSMNIDRSQGALQDVKVRQAISYAIDRKALAKANSNGLTDRAAVQPYPPGNPWHFDDLDSAYVYNPEKAKALLAEAGYSNGLTLRGVTLKGAGFINNGLVVADQLSKVGVTIVFDPLDVPEATKAFLVNHDYDMMSTGQNSGPDWLSIFRRILSTSSTANPGNVTLPGGEEALALANAASTDAETTAAVRQMVKVMQDQVPLVPLYYSPFVMAWTDKTSGAEDAISLNGEIDYTALGLNS